MIRPCCGPRLCIGCFDSCSSADIPDVKRRVSASRLRVYLICVALALFSLVPLVAESYFPNTAHATLEEFIQRSVAGVNTSTAFVVSHSTLWKLVWACYLNLEELGLIFGAFAAPLLTQRLGRPRTVAAGLCFAIPGRVLQVLATLPDAWWLLFVGKAVGNVGLGIITVILPIFVSEVSDVSQRDRLGILNPLGHSLGALTGAVLGLKYVLGDTLTWPYAYAVFILLLFPAIPILISLPESPVFLLASAGSQTQVVQSLRFYQGDERNLASAEEDAKFVGSNGPGFRTFGLLFTARPMRRSLMLASSVAFCYFPVVLIQHYSTIMLERAGLADETAGHGSIAIKAASIATFLVCLCLAGSISRRKQVVAGYFGVCLCMTALFVCQLLIVHFDAGPNASLAFFLFLMLLQVCLNFGIRPVFWAVVPEMFPFPFRATAKSAMNALCFGNMMLMSLSFLPLLFEAGAFTYLIFATFLWLGFLYCARNFPDMNGIEPHHIFRLIAGDEFRPNLGSGEKTALRKLSDASHHPNGNGYGTQRTPLKQ